MFLLFIFFYYIIVDNQRIVRLIIKRDGSSGNSSDKFSINFKLQIIGYFLIIFF